jgi:ParB-like chromosome segregation protein Spo0J
MRSDLWPDKDLLEALSLVGQGWTRKAIGQRVGRSKNSVIGTLHRIQNEEVRGSAGDGTMPAEWWRDGLAKR